MFTFTAFVVISSLAMLPGDGRSDDMKPVGQPAEAAALCFCQADFDHSGTIDGADLGHLLADWGTPGSDLNGSGGTDGADLGILLGDWGACGTTPSNDLCANAINIDEGTISFCTHGATNSGPSYPVGSACIQFGYDSIDSDIWYSYTASALGMVKISTCGTPWDTRLAVYAHVFPDGVTTCPGPNAMFIGVAACNDDFPGCALNSEVNFFVVPGQQYLVRVGGYIGYSGEGTLALDFTSQGQTCEDAIDLGSIHSNGTDRIGTTLDNDPAPDASPCGTNDTIPEWYKFRTGCQFPGDPQITVTTCHSYTDFDTVISVWKAGTSQCLGQFMACNDDSPDTNCQIEGLNRRSKVTFTAEFNTEYYIRVAGYQGDKGDFLLIVSPLCP